MAIVVETGAGVTGANSLVTRSTYISYAADVGTTIADDADADAELIDAMRVIDSVEPYLQSFRIERDQALSFPRYSMYIDGWYWDSDEIPTAAKDAQMEIALYIHAGNDPYNPIQRKLATLERVEGAVTVEYAAGRPNRDTESERWEILLSKLYRSPNRLSLTRA